VYWRLNRYDDAERVLRRAIWLDSTAAEPYVLMGRVLIKKQFVAAERCLRQAINLEPGTYTAHYFLGQPYRQMGRAEAAAREMKKSAEIQQRMASNPRYRN
jgi:tetratricopeptide (TPR) repeat protein